MIITVASGKGGTGKTTVAASLALSITTDLRGSADRSVNSANLLFLDCDVEEPNAALFLKPTLDHREEVGIMIPQVDFDKCTYCGRCAEVCVWHAIAVVGEKVLIFPELCHGCGSCTLNCPEGAIHEALNVTGSLEWGTAGPIDFAQGTMDVGQAMGVPIISQLKKKHLPAAEADERVVILDAQPGTSCPVVETMRDADFVLLVTEPTPFGLHDLRLAVQVARDELGLPLGVVVNREGVGDAGVDEYCAAEGLPILMRIPLDRRIAEAISEGRTLVEALPEYRPAFRALYNEIARRVADGGGVLMENFAYRPIGVIHSPFAGIENAPIQPASARGIGGEVEILAEFAAGLKDLEGFSHIILLYHFHRVTQVKLTVTPFLDEAPHGVFATRAPTRPNPIGLSVVRLLGMEGRRLHIEDVDVLDGTPLLDIKPCVPEFDHPSVERIGWLAAARAQIESKRSDGRFK